VRPPAQLLRRVPRVHGRPLRFGAEVALTRACLAFTGLVTVALLGALVHWAVTYPEPMTLRVVLGQGVFVAGMGALLFGSVVYMVARLGYLQRARRFRPATRDEVADVYDDPASLAVLVPSYREDPHLVRTTLLSAALQGVPHHRVVLLIDDPPDPTDPDEAERLEATRRIPQELQATLDAPARLFAEARDAFQERRGAGALDAEAETARVAELWDRAAAWFWARAREMVVADHVDAFVRHEVLERAGEQLRAVAADLRWRAANEPLDPDGLAHEHRRLAARFDVELSSFERKRWVNLSHAPNKAMNLNSHLQLLGGTYRVARGADGDVLQPAPDGKVVIPDAEFVITLDADSVLAPDYAEELLHVIRRPGNEDLGLVQTPYSAFPGAPGAVERVAGATTDLMCLVHQGTSRWDAAYWVGANALLRVAALRDIATTRDEDGHPVTRFIRDRTLVEDTESTVDLVQRGWRLHNHPARLAHSATPPDFGSLLVQRRRWANGGLLVLPSFLRAVRERRGRTGPHPLGVLLRVNYLTSLAAANVAFLVLMSYSFDGVFAPVWLPLLSVGYFWLYARDLHQSGYRRRDVVRVYALTLLLIPVHLGGVMRSLQQAWTGRAVPFGRTPKVPSRTPVPALYVLAILGLLAFWTITAIDDVGDDRNGRAVFTALNVGLLGWAVTRFMGWRAVVGDLWLRISGRVTPWAAGRTQRDARRPWWRRPGALAARLAVVPLCLLLVVTAGAFLRMRNVSVEGLADAPFPRMNVLVVGTDSREGLTARERDDLSLGTFEGSRADTLFVLSVQGDRAATLAFPRDLLVRRCDGSRGRINESLEIDGPGCLVDTVGRVSGLPISHYVEVDFTGLMDVVDAVGGVEMDLDRAIRDDKTGADLPAGRQRLGSQEALAFVRVRSIDSDLGRIERQQEFVQALAGEIGSSRTITNPVAATRVVGAASGALTVDRDTGPVDLGRIAYAVAQAVEEDRMATATVPTDAATIDGQELLVEDRDAARPLYAAFADGSALQTGPGDTDLAARLRPVGDP
jgi:cellulose synthase (UDP-forming)